MIWFLQKIVLDLDPRIELAGEHVAHLTEAVVTFSQWTIRASHHGPFASFLKLEGKAAFGTMLVTALER
jgi:hypothetical protein